MAFSDSEPDFDDIQPIEIPSARDVDAKSQAHTRSHDRTTSSTKRVTKPSQRLSRIAKGGAGPVLSTTARKVLMEKSRNNTVVRPGNDEKHRDELDDIAQEQGIVKAYTRHELGQLHELNPNGSSARIGIAEQHNDQDVLMEHGSGLTSLPQTTESLRRLGKQDAAPRFDGERQFPTTYNISTDDVPASVQLGELTKKYNSLENRHLELREVGVKAAERNFERLKKQLEENTAASNKLIQSLKEELGVQTALVKQGEYVRTQLERSETNVGDLERKIDNLTASLSTARSEIKSLSAKLAASRAAEASIKVPGSALKPGTAANKSAPSEIVLAAQAKEDLYGDLTGLIVRGMSGYERERVFDCIQTGRNGTLHFKLALEAGEASDNYDDVQFTYRPQLNTDRDGNLMEMLPDYLVEEITFPRAQASRFYSRVNKSLTERMS